MGDGQPTSHVNVTGKSATAVSGLMTVQSFRPADLADTRQSVPAGWPVPV
jgi:hypothetical protein